MSEEKNISPENNPEDKSEKLEPENKNISPPEPVVEKEQHKTEQPVTNNKQPETRNSKPETETMEIHHTHHHDAPGHKEKQWKHYLFEFLLLFLAVTAGFFVENQREHYIEHQRAESYAASMKNDLSSDSLQLILSISRLQNAVNNIDTFFQLIAAKEAAEIETGKLYWYGLFGGYTRAFLPNDATFQQMKSSGSLRYFTNKSLSHKIASYDQLIRNIQALIQQDIPVHTEIRKQRARIFIFRYNNAANVITLADSLPGHYSRVDSFIRSNSPILKFDAVTFNEYAEFFRTRQRILVILLRIQKQALQIASEIIDKLKKEYHLE